MMLLKYVILLVSAVPLGLAGNFTALDYLYNPLDSTRPDDWAKDTAQRISERGYPAHTHDVITEDGYVLKMFHLRANSSLESSQPRQAVLLMHGLISSSDIWVLPETNSSLAFLLADAGFDVFLGNARGNIYGRRHVHITSHETPFWRFSWHEIGFYDLSAMCDKILLITGADRLHFVGFSQGTTALLVLLSSRPEYMRKIERVHLMAPVAYADHMRDAVVRVLTPLLGHPSTVSSTLGSREFLPFTELYLRLSYAACQESFPFGDLCSSAAYLVEGSGYSANWTVLQQLASTHPAGASTDQLIHYLQVRSSSNFCQFNFGERYNQKIYGQPHPPAYKLEQIRLPIHLWYSDSDETSVTLDVFRLASRLPAPVLHHVENFKHGSFVTANEVRQIVYEPIVRMLRGLDHEITMQVIT